MTASGLSLPVPAPRAVRGPRRTRGERRADVLAAASATFAERGYAAPAALIAARAGISEPYLFRLFATKHELFAACARELTDRTRAVLEGAAAAGASPAERLRRMVDAYATELTADDHRLHLHLLGTGDGRVRRLAREALDGLVEDVGRLSGASAAGTRSLVAQALLIDVTAALRAASEPGAAAVADTPDTWEEIP